MANKTMALLRNLSEPPSLQPAAAGRDHRLDPPPAGAPPAAAAAPSGRNVLLNDASGGRGFGCAAGWVDPDK